MSSQRHPAPCAACVASQDVTKSAYARDIVFEDPISRFTDVDGYQFMIQALKTLFSVTFDLHDVTVTAPDTVTTRCAVLRHAPACLMHSQQLARSMLSFLARHSRHAACSWRQIPPGLLVQLSGLVGSKRP